VRHRKFEAWRQQRNQAQYRGEAWSLGFDLWVEIWGDQWDQRGRTRGSLCMSRRDWERGWHASNVQIVTREEHARMQALHRERVRGVFQS